MREGHRHHLLAAGLIGGVLSLGLALAIATEEGRAPALQALQGMSEDGRTLAFSANSCKGNPEAAVISQDSGKVVVRVVSDVQTGDSLGCADGVSVRLAEALGDRRVVDEATDKPAPRSKGCCRLAPQG